jgi:hypothetical protein
MGAVRHDLDREKNGRSIRSRWSRGRILSLVTVKASRRARSDFCLRGTGIDRTPTISGGGGVTAFHHGDGIPDQADGPGANRQRFPVRFGDGGVAEQDGRDFPVGGAGKVRVEGAQHEDQPVAAVGGEPHRTRQSR